MILLNQIENFVLWEGLLLTFGALLTLSMGVYYLYRYKSTKSPVTLHWGLGFTILGLGMSIKIVFVNYYELFGGDVQNRTDLFQELFVITTLYIFLTFLALSIFYLQFFSEEVEKLGSKVVVVFGIISIIYHVVVTVFDLGIFNLGLILLFSYSLFILAFFSYLAIKTKDWRIGLISVGMLGSALVRVRYIPSIHQTSVGLIILFFAQISYALIGLGLLYPAQKES